MDPNVLITIAARLGQLQQGMQQATGVVTNAVNQMKQQLTTLSSHSANASNQVSQSMGKAGASVAGLTRRYLELAAIMKSYNAMAGFVRGAVETNAAMETARLGIASIIVAQTKMKDASGAAVEGTAKLNAALEIGAEQFQKLRIAGLQTAATTTELVEAYQAALSSGLAAGLSFDQIRVLSVRIVQAAQAMGLPMRYMREEVQSILRGQITQNSVVAKNLELTGAQVRNWIQQGELAERLIERLGAFGMIGEKVAESWNGVTSNMREAVQVISADMAKGMFGTLSRAMNETLGRVFDMKSGTVAASFRNVTAAGTAAFDLLGSAGVRALSGLITMLENIGQWFVDNRETVTAFLDSIRAFGDAAAGALGNLFSAIGMLITTALPTLTSIFNGLSAVLSSTVVQFTALALVMRTVVLSSFAALATRLPTFVALLQLLPAALAGGASGMSAFASLAASAVNPVVLLTGALVAAGFALERYVSANQRAAEAGRDAARAEGQREAGFQRMANEALKLNAQIKDTNTTEQRRKELTEQLKDLQDQILSLYPDLLKNMTEEEKAHLKIADAIGRTYANRVAELEDQASEKRAERNKLVAEIAELEAKTAKYGSATYGDSPSAEARAAAGAGIYAISAEKLKRDRVALTAVDDTLATLEARIARLRAPFTYTPLPNVIPSGGRVGGDDGDKDKTNELVRKWEAELDEIQAINADAYHWSNEFELYFWGSKLALAEKGTKAYAAVIDKVNRGIERDTKDSHERRLADLQTQLADEKYDAEARLAITEQMIQEEIEAHGVGSREVEEAIRKRNTVLRQMDRDMIDDQLAAYDARLGVTERGFDAEADLISFAAEQREITGREEINKLIELETQKFNIKVAALEAMKALEPDPDKQRTIQQRIEEATIGFNQRIGQLNIALAREQRRVWNDLFNVIENGFGNAIKSMIRGTQSFGQAFRQILGSVLDFFIDMLVEMLFNWIRTMVLTKIFGKSTNASNIASGAGVAAVNAMASVAAIPMVGWAMAPAVFASTLALGLSALGTLASAAGGWDIPKGLNPVTQLHEEEMVLPAHIANPIRAMIAEGRGEGGGSVQNINIYAADARSFRDMLRRNKGAVVEITNELLRDGRTK